MGQFDCTQEKSCSAQKMNIKWSEDALEDLRNLHAYVSAENPIAAQKLAMTIIDAVETNLPDNPHMGRPGRVSGTRELVITKNSYIVPYRVKFGVIQILRVYHGARRWPDKL
jgi:toxin ParE1/3/4